MYIFIKKITALEAYSYFGIKFKISQTQAHSVCFISIPEVNCYPNSTDLLL